MVMNSARKNIRRVTAGAQRRVATRATGSRKTREGQKNYKMVNK